jgi:hypothetical protein
MITTKNKVGLLHSIDDQPSLIEKENIYWHKDGLLHRNNDLPSIIMNNGDKYWHINGVPSRLDISLPYVEMSNGNKEYRLEDGGKRIIGLREEEWFNKDDYSHREDGPSYVSYYENNNVYSEKYYLNGILHREDGPAVIFYYSNGKIKYEQYYLNGKKHRGDGPAWIKYDGNRRIEFEDYYLNGVQYFKKDYLEKIKQLNSCNKMS